MNNICKGFKKDKTPCKAKEREMNLEEKVFDFIGLFIVWPGGE